MSQRKIKLTKEFGQLYSDLMENEHNEKKDLDILQLLDLAILLIQNIPSLRQLPRVIKHPAKPYYAMYLAGEYLYVTFIKREPDLVIISKIERHDKEIWPFYTPL